MKKTLNVNLNGRVFTIDEDAYRLLDNYLNNLRIHFRKEEGASDIIADFEARIEELLSEKTRLGHQVITFEHVEEVIARVGRPADFTEQADRDYERQPSETEQGRAKKRFYRNLDDKMLGGVCSGIAAYFGWSVVALRFLFVLLPFILSSLNVFIIRYSTAWGSHSQSISFSFGIILAYLIAWVIVPGARNAEQKLQMQGKPITVENIGKTVAAESAPVAPVKQRGCLAGIVDLFVAFVKVCLAGLGCLIGLPLLFALFIVIIVLIAVLLGVGGNLLGIGGGLPAGIMPPFLAVKYPILTTITGILVLGIPIVAVIYGIISHIAKWKPLNQSVKWASLLIWILALILFCFSGIRIDRRNGFDYPWRWHISDYHDIRGNNIPSQETIGWDEAVDYLELGKHLYATVQIEQTWDETTSVEINGDENLVAQVKYELRDGRLKLFSENRLRRDNNLKIILRTNHLKGLDVDYIGDVRIYRAFTGDDFKIKMSGVGNIQADSLNFNSLTVLSSGVGSVKLSGKAETVHLETSGTGKINAIELLSNTVYAEVSGIGTIQCNPIEHLKGRVSGIGSITYKEEPKHKDTGSSGIGKIKKR